MLRLPLEVHALILGPPRSGKTGLLASAVLHYPGPVLSTTTKADVFGLTSGIRAGLGPVHVFNPQGVGGVPSTFRWNPIRGCEDQATAIRRADALTRAVSVDGTEDASFWQGKASSYMRAIFHAAALAGGDMRMVTRWALGSPLDAEEVLTAAGAHQWALELAQLRGEALKTAETIRMVMSQALAFMTDPALALAVMPADGDLFDMAELLRRRGSLYMVAVESDQSPLAPLFACMASELHYTAAQLGSKMPGGRLDPPLLMALDEVCQVCPVPLPVWAADSGGKGIQLLTVAHGEAQLAARYKEDGKQIIMDTAGCLAILPGVKDTDTLDRVSKLCGDAAYTEHGQEHMSRHPVVTADMIRQMPPGRALLVCNSLAPVIGMLPRAWRDRAYRSAKRRGNAVAQITAAAMPALDGEPLRVAVEMAQAAAAQLPGRSLDVPGDVREAEHVLVTSNGHRASYPWDGQQ